MSKPLKRVLFVCLGNACRSQMAEGFARAYGSDVIIPASAGLTPAYYVAPDTMRAMAEKGLDLRDHFPKHVRHITRAQFDLIINMSGMRLPAELNAPVRTWDVEDPIAVDYDQHRGIRDYIERLVMELIIELRREQNSTEFRGQGSRG